MASQLLIHEPYFMVDKKMEPPEEMKNDFQNALKRNLHSWAQWRTDVNNSLVDSLFTGQPMDEVGSLDGYLQHHQRPLPTESPKTLLSYSASRDTNTNLRRDHFLSFGIPRIKKASGSSTSTSGGSSHRTSTRNLSRELGGGNGDDYGDDDVFDDDQRTMSHRPSQHQTMVATRNSPPVSATDKRLPRTKLHPSANRLPRRDIHGR